MNLTGQYLFLPSVLMIKMFCTTNTRHCLAKQESIIDTTSCMRANKSTESAAKQNNDESKRYKSIHMCKLNLNRSNHSVNGGDLVIYKNTNISYLP